MESHDETKAPYANPISRHHFVWFNRWSLRSRRTQLHSCHRVNRRNLLPVGVALATLTKVKLTPSYHFSLSAISSAGSGENVKLMNDNEAQFAILQGLYGAWAWAGEGPYAERQNQLRSVSMLWQNVEHFIVRSDLAPMAPLPIWPA